MEMDDEAFARMLQQQLLDEERMLLEQQQEQERGAAQPLPPQGSLDQYQTHGGGGGYNQDPRNRHYDGYQSSAYGSQQEPFDPQAYARKLQQQGFHKSQEGNPARDIRGYDNSHGPPGEDPDLALARRMHELETMGMGNHEQDTFRSPGGSDRTRYEQEEEDARLARLMAQSGQSLRDIDFQQSTGSRETTSHTPPRQFPSSHRAGGSVGRSGHPNVSYPEHNQTHPGMAPTPQYPDGTRIPLERNVQGRNMQGAVSNLQMNRPSAPGGTSTPSRGQGSSVDQRGRSREFEVQSFGNPDTMHQEGYTPKMPPGYSGQRPIPEDANSRQRKPPNAGRDVHGQRPLTRSPLSRDQASGSGRPPFSREEPMQPMAMGSPVPPSMQHTQAGPSRQPRGRLSASPPRTERNGPPMDLLPGDAFLDVPAPTKKKDKKKKRGLLGIFGRNGEKESEPAAKAHPAAKAASSHKSDESRGLFGRGARGSGAKTAHEDPDARLADEMLASNGKGKVPGQVNLKSVDDDDAVVRFPIPEPVPRPADTIGAPKGPLPYSLTVSKDAPKLPEATIGRRPQISLSRSSAICAACNRPGQNLLSALDKKYHNDCFRCITCHDFIDSTGAFAFIENGGEKQPMHRKCYAEIFGVKCCVCKQSIPAGPDGKVSFVKHPFFDTEQMCPRHARNLTRRCTGCHRFEPENEPFADLNDVGRCVCFSCCRSVIVDSQDAQPLWAKVVDFFEQKLNMPIWKDFREVPILVVGYNALNDQMNNTSNVHGGASQIMTRGLCLTEHESGRRFRMNRMKFDRNNMSFVANDAEERGFTYFQVPDASKVNPDASVTAILCLSGLPRDLSASVLAHEATHAWIKLHPRFDFERPIPPQVEEGCAQLIALLFLNEGLDPPEPLDNNDGSGPSDEKLRQYFKFSIETDDHEIYGTGYRRAAMAYSKIGIEALMSHIVLYQDFPET